MRLSVLCWTVALAATLGAPTWAAQTITVGGDSGKTIADGVALLQPGDTLEIEPGIYHEPVLVPCDNVTIESAGPGVILDGTVTLSQSDMTPAPGRPGVFTWQFPTGADLHYLPWVFVHDQPLVYTTSPLDPTTQAWSFYTNQDKRQLEVVFDGKGWPANVTLVVPVIHDLVQSWDHTGVTIRGLTVIRPQGCGISCGKNDIAEDNVVLWTGGQGIVGRDGTIIRRNTMKFCNTPGVILYGNNMTIQDNLIVACGLSLSGLDWDGSEVKINAQSDNTFTENWLVDRPHGGMMKVDGQPALSKGKPVINKWVLNSGLWPDVDCFHNDFIDNCIARLSHSAIYIEYNCNRNTIAMNDIQDCAMGITVREASNNVITRNWVWDHEGLGWGKVDKEGFAGFGPGYYDDGSPITVPYLYNTATNDPGAKRIVDALGSATWGPQMDDGLCIWHSFPQMTPPSRDNVESQNLVQVSGVSVSVPLADNNWPSAAVRAALPEESTLSNQLTNNFYTRPAGSSIFALLGKTKVKTFDQYKQLTSWDSNSKVGKYTPAAIGLEALWTIPSAALNKTPVSILYDPSIESFSIDSNTEPLFWRGSEDHSLWEGAPETLFTRDPKLAHSGSGALEVKNQISADSRPVWWTSSAIPVTSGITMGLNIWVSADSIQGATPADGVQAKLRFTDATGHLVGDWFLIGNGSHSELGSGSYKYTNVSGSSVVPEGACWMTVYLGSTVSSGTVCFDDIHMGMINPAPHPKTN